MTSIVTFEGEGAYALSDCREKTIEDSGSLHEYC